MAFSASLAARVREILDRTAGVDEKRMFGSVGFLLHGNMLVGVWKESLIVRVGPAAYTDVLLEPHVREFDVTGRPMTGWVLVDADGIEEDEPLRDWVRRATAFVETLPAK